MPGLAGIKRGCNPFCRPGTHGPTRTSLNGAECLLLASVDRGVPSEWVLDAMM